MFHSLSSPDCFYYILSYYSSDLCVIYPCFCLEISNYSFAGKEEWYFLKRSTLEQQTTALESLSDSYFPALPLIYPKSCLESFCRVSCVPSKTPHVGGLPCPGSACRAIPQSWPLSALAQVVWVWGTGKGPKMVGECCQEKFPKGCNWAGLPRQI